MHTVVGEFDEAKIEKRIRYLYAHPRYLGDELETLMECCGILGRCVYRR